jgi:hypothetical protein
MNVALRTSAEVESGWATGVSLGGAPVAAFLAGYPSGRPGGRTGERGNARSEWRTSLGAFSRRLSFQGAATPRMTARFRRLRTRSIGTH